MSAHVSHNSLHAGELPTLIKEVYDAFQSLGSTRAPEPAVKRPQVAVTSRKGLSDPAHIVSMIDGKPYKTLRRHMSKHGNTPESYRETFGLARD